MTVDESFQHCHNAGLNMIATALSEHENRLKWLKDHKPELFSVEVAPAKRELVNQPSHYNSHESGFPAVLFMNHMCANLSNAFKYIYRMEHKGTRDLDINKAVWYIKNEIKYVKMLCANNRLSGLLHSSQLMRRQLRQSDKGYMRSVGDLGKCLKDNGSLLCEMINLDDYLDMESRNKQLGLMVENLENMRKEDVTTG